MDLCLEKIWSIYKIRKLEEEDIKDIYNLCKENTKYYEYYKEKPTFNNIKEIFTSLPYNMTIKDKFFIGFYKENKLIAILDLITNYPNENSVYIGLFITNKSIQNKGIGSKIIEELCNTLKNQGFNNIELACIEDNIEAKNFWLKNKFSHNNKSSKLDNYNVLCMFKKL